MFQVVHEMCKKPSSLWRWPRRRRSPDYENTKYPSNQEATSKDVTKLVVESPVHVLPKQRLSNGRESVDLQQAQTLLEGVVDLNLALATDNNHTTGTVP